MKTEFVLYSNHNTALMFVVGAVIIHKGGRSATHIEPLIIMALCNAESVIASLQI